MDIGLRIFVFKKGIVNFDWCKRAFFEGFEGRNGLKSIAHIRAFFIQIFFDTGKSSVVGKLKVVGVQRVILRGLLDNFALLIKSYLEITLT